MPLDPNIILQGQAPQLQNPLDTAVKAMTLKDLSQKSQIQDRAIADDQAVRDAFKNNMTIGPNGQPTLNRQAALSQLAATSPQKAMDYAKAFQGQDLDKLEYEGKVMSKLFAPVRDDVTYQQAVIKAQQMGISTASQLPTVYNPTFVSNLNLHLLDGAEQLKQMNADRESKISQQKADAETAGVDIKKADLDLQRKKLYGGNGQPGASAKSGQAASMDPALLVPTQVPEHHQAKAFGEIEAAQNTRANASKILTAFDNAANKVHGVDFVPGMANADQKSLHALMGPTFKDVEGTVRQAAMDNMNENTTPQFGDSKATIEKKRSALIGYLKSKSSAPTALGYGIDLKKFPSTALTDKALGNTVQMLDPKGNIRDVPVDQVDAAKKAGGKEL